MEDLGAHIDRWNAALEFVQTPVGTILLSFITIATFPLIRLLFRWLGINALLRAIYNMTDGLLKRFIDRVDQRLKVSREKSKKEIELAAKHPAFSASMNGRLVFNALLGLMMFLTGATLSGALYIPTEPISQDGQLDSAVSTVQQMAAFCIMVLGLISTFSAMRNMGKLYNAAKAVALDREMDQGIAEIVANAKLQDDLDSKWFKVETDTLSVEHTPTKTHFTFTKQGENLLPNTFENKVTMSAERRDQMLRVAMDALKEALDEERGQRRMTMQVAVDTRDSAFRVDTKSMKVTHKESGSVWSFRLQNGVPSLTEYAIARPLLGMNERELNVQATQIMIRAMNADRRAY